ncbi:MAG: NTP transferase domain-containing protein [Clostridium sp.]|nr:NTP transferase domain-containing protein [Prevotella sp.]MCM1428410.1 NTP transferase domain-containing protein [Clostridium sp.]MCM1476259.1 NTP transferase domain-containing protein [Muribaculaceae bacterium]
MHFGIIAAGEGSRLSSEGATVPKPLIAINGTPMIERLIRIFESCGAQSINVVINDKMPEVAEFLNNLPISEGVELNIRVKTTPSSMHTFGELAEMFRGKGRFIATTVDTIFEESEFRRYVEGWEHAPAEADGLMAVTDYIDDEKPLYVATAPDLEILAFRDTADDNTRYISGGIYGLDNTALEVLDDCLQSGVSRMRNYQRALIASGLRLHAWPMGKIIDVDHLGDIAKAEQLVEEIGGGRQRPLS